MTRWFYTALVFALGAIGGWVAIAVGASKSDEKAQNSAAVSVVAKAAPAAQPAASNPKELDALRDRLTKKLPEIARSNINPSPIPGLYEIQRGHLFGYVTGDGRYLIQGDLVDIEKGEEITENHRRADRLAAVASLGDEYIEFAPKPPIQTKHTVTVFTDVDCGYCRKLHSEIAGYNAQGIAMRYVFFPRTGPNTPSFAKAQEVWCSADRKEALTRAKRGEKLSAGASCANPILKEYQLGVELGVRGTPAMVLPNGDLFPGYVPPTQLASMLNAPNAALAQEGELDPANVAP
jgi:thiol:disulfide interchange protein DsbC